MGKLSHRDYCFKNKNSSKSFDVNGTCNTSSMELGTVGVKLNFEVSKDLLSNRSSGVIISNFTGRDVGTQIRG